MSEKGRVLDRFNFFDEWIARFVYDEGGVVFFCLGYCGVCCGFGQDISLRGAEAILFSFLKFLWGVFLFFWRAGPKGAWFYNRLGVNAGEGIFSCFFLLGEPGPFFFVRERGSFHRVFWTKGTLVLGGGGTLILGEGGEVFFFKQDGGRSSEFPEKDGTIVLSEATGGEFSLRSLLGQIRLEFNFFRGELKTTVC